MLSVSSYPQDYIDACRAGVARQVSAYETLAAAAGDVAQDGQLPLSSAIDAFEPLFFNTMVLVLDACFVHRARTMEKKDGNPLNEVRALCSSILENDAVLMADKTIRLKPATSLLKYEVGDQIKLSQRDFSLLAEGFFAEVESKYP
jgi:hypothetical protein